jgi:hypothetical protein
MKWIPRFAAALLLTLSCLCSTALAQDQKTMSIAGVPPNPKLEVVSGNGWVIYLDGTITAGDGKRLEKYIVEHHVPSQSWVVLNSPGGNLFEGMELGRIIRKYYLRTDVARRRPNSSNQFDYLPGGCYSACTLAYVGGRFRFLHSASHFGIHRFAFTSPQKNESDMAQIASASIVAYLRSMDIDPDLFTLSTQAGSAEIYEPTKAELEKLNVVTNGFNKPKWSIESNNGLLYLKGERDTVYGINKFIMFCFAPGKMGLHVIFDPQGRQNEVIDFGAHSLMINGQQYAVDPVDKQIANGWFNAEYALSPQQVNLFTNASSVGLVVQMIGSAPVFFGFDNMPFEEGAKKLAGLLNSCGLARQGYRP